MHDYVAALVSAGWATKTPLDWPSCSTKSSMAATRTSSQGSRTCSRGNPETLRTSPTALWSRMLTMDERPI